MLFCKTNLKTLDFKNGLLLYFYKFYSPTFYQFSNYFLNNYIHLPCCKLTFFAISETNFWNYQAFILSKPSKNGFWFN